MDGDVKKVTSSYFDFMDDKIHANSVIQSAKNDIPEEVDVRVFICDDNGQSTETIDYMGNLNVVIDIKCVRPLINPVFSVGVHTVDMLYLTASRSDTFFIDRTIEPGRHLIKCTISSFPLTPGVYSIRMSLIDGLIQHDCFYGEKLATFTVCSESFEHSIYRNECFLALPSYWTL